MNHALEMTDGSQEALEMLRQAMEAAEAAKEASQATEASSALMAQRVETISRMAEANHRLLHGNGEEGFKGRLSHVERTARENGRRIDEELKIRSLGFTARLGFWKDVIVGLLALAGTVIASWLAITMN